MHLPPRYWPELFCWCIKFLRLAPLPRVAGARRCRFDPCRASSYPRLLSGTLVWGLTWRVRLNALPGQLFDKALPERDALVQAAVTAEIALAIQIELVAPMRLANLAALHLEKNVIRVGGPDPTYHLVIPPEDVKNEEPLEYPLPEIVGEMMGLYLGMFRTRLKLVALPWGGRSPQNQGYPERSDHRAHNQATWNKGNTASISPPSRVVHPGEGPG
jgi:hypothetical protein